MEIEEEEEEDNDIVGNSSELNTSYWGKYRSRWYHHNLKQMKYSFKCYVEQCCWARPAYGFTPYPTMECLIDLILELGRGLGYGDSQHFPQGVAITSSAFSPS